MEDVENLRRILTPTMFDESNPILEVQPLTSPITPPDDNYEAPTTNPILDELLNEFGDEVLDVTVIDEEAGCNPTKDVELEPVLYEKPLSFNVDEGVNMAVIEKPVSQKQHGMSQSSTNTGMVRREMKSPLRYNYNSSFPYLIANSHPHGVYSYFHPHLIPSEGMNTLIRSK